MVSMASWSRSVATVIGRAPIGGLGRVGAPRLGHCSHAPAILRRCRPSPDPAARNGPGCLAGPRDRHGPGARAGPAGQRSARIVVLGDLMLDVVVAPARALESGTDVPGRVSLVQGGSAANTARWLGRLGARSSLITAVGRDAAGRVLVETLRATA